MFHNYRECINNQDGDHSPSAISLVSKSVRKRADVLISDHPSQFYTLASDFQFGRRMFSKATYRETTTTTTTTTCTREVACCRLRAASNCMHDIRLLSANWKFLTASVSLTKPGGAPSIRAPLIGDGPT